MDLYKPIELNYKEKYRNLDVEAKGEVRSTKYFPVFLQDGEEYIFKPLSKTKPLTTPLFAYSEVFWSNIIKRYFDHRTPQYFLAYCKGLSNDQIKYYDKGTLVKSIIKPNQRLVNLLEIFNKNPEENFDISNYVNFCMQKYDYTQILKSFFLKNNPDLGKKLCFQILLSILRLDQNFHYENVNFIEENNKIIDIAPPIDFEFSTMFLYPDSPLNNENYQQEYLKTPEPFNFKDCISEVEIKNIFVPKTYTVFQNIIKIIKIYPEVIYDFILKLENLLNETDTIYLNDNFNYIDPCNSESWNIGDARYKNNDEELAKKYENLIKPIELNKEKLFKKIISDTKENANKLLHILKVYLYNYENAVNDIENIPFSILEELYKNSLSYSLKKK